MTNVTIDQTVQDISVTVDETTNNITVEVAIAGSSGTSDHGSLSGLGDDDHTQYALADGSRGSFASTAQGALADSALQSGDNVSELTNDAGYITSASVPTNTSDLTNDGADNTSTYVEHDELGAVATSNDYNDLDNLPSMPSGTVTSVAVSGSDGIEVDSGSPITTSGTIALGINKTTLLNFLGLSDTYVLGLAFGDETSDMTTGTAKLTFQMPNFATTLVGVSVNVKTAPTGSTAVFDLKENGTTVLSTQISIDAGETTSETAATPPVISDSSLAANAIMTVDIDQVGSTVAGVAPKIWIYYKRA